VINRDKLRWFGHFEHETNKDWVKHCMTEVDGTSWRVCLKTTWWDCVRNDVEGLSLSLEDAQHRTGGENINGATDLPGKWLLK